MPLPTLYVTHSNQTMTQQHVIVMSVLLFLCGCILFSDGLKELKHATKELRKIYGKRANKSN